MDRPPASAVQDPRSRALDGLRGLAALTVLGFHVWLYRENRPTGTRHALADQLGFGLHLGLLCFFVLSGFLLYRGFARAALRDGVRPVAIGRYALRRAARILPAYWGCIAGCLALYALAGYSAITPSPGELPLFALLAQNYGLGTLMQLNPVTWTLSVEVAFYALLPLVGVAALALGPRRPGRQALLLCSLIGATVLWSWLDLRGGWSEVARKTLPTYLGDFAFGMIAALWVEQRVLRGRAALGSGATLALALCGLAIVVSSGAWAEHAALAPRARFVGANLVTSLGMALIVAAAATGRGALVRVLGARPLAGAGLISYGIYLWHLPLLLVLKQAGLLPVALTGRLAIVLSLSLLAGWLSWRLLERPAIAWAARRTGRRSPALASGRALPATP